MEFDVLSIVQMIGGLALFIYGMTTMGKGLERAAGSKLEKTLEKMTGNVFTALIMGMVVTMVIQSSSATTVMVVGFVNAGIMTLKQSVGVILGANIGTTITAQILRLSGGEGSGNLFMDLLKPKNLAYIIVLVGVIIMMIAKKRRTRDIADIFTGFGILFIGMSVMEGAVAPLADLPQFADLFAAISNPVLGVLVGAGVTAIIQSSSASVGILQALSCPAGVLHRRKAQRRKAAVRRGRQWTGMERLPSVSGGQNRAQRFPAKQRTVMRFGIWPQNSAGKWNVWDCLIRETGSLMRRWNISMSPAWC